MTNEEPLLEVGIVSGVELTFSFPSVYRIKGNKENRRVFEGEHKVSLKCGMICLENETFNTLEFEPIVREGSAFELFNVTIGINFHWERTEIQKFEGNLKFIIEGDKITAINRVPLEAYLKSVISSEMSAQASEELLKAHAVISRSWIISQLVQKGKNLKQKPGIIENETERIIWHDREDHANFDVCADDHCQRYQGITKESTEKVKKAVDETRGQVIVSGEEICDARFSKCCGGMTEEFGSCWEDKSVPYLIGFRDYIEKEGNDNKVAIPDLTNEENAKKWILEEPEAFCNTKDKRILDQVLNNYDQETTDFYRWIVSYSTKEISSLVSKKTGIDFGTIEDLIPIERGVSGRITKLRISGTKKTLVIGKELEIRRALSPSHLYSSAFVVEKSNFGFTLHGAGWGHGVGLCQIGAAVMGEKGFSYDRILNHYYPNTTLKNIYL